MKVVSKILIIVSVFAWFGCEEAFEEKTYPYVVSLDPQVDNKGVTLKADVLGVGNVSVQSYGFVLGNTEALDLSDAITIKNRKFKEGEYSFTIQSSLEDGVIYYARPYINTNSYVVYGDQVSFTSKGSLAPQITSFTPSEGGIGTSVVISGANLGYLTSLTTVKFGNTPAVIDSVVNDKLYTKVPTITERQTVKITITTAGIVATSAANFDMWFPWKRMANYPGTYVTTLTGFAAQGKLYVLSGLKPDPNREIIKEFWQFDPGTNAWTSLTPFPGSARFDAVAFACNGKGYYGLGRNDSGYFRDLWEYDPGSGMWTQKKDYPGTTRYDQFSFTAQEMGFVGLGYTFPGPVYSKEMWKYDPVANDWTQIADFAGAGRNPGLALSAGQKGYMGMGNITEKLTDIYEYNPTGNAWTLVTNYPGLAHTDMASFFIGGKIYAGLGNSGGVSNTDFREFDPATLTWKSMQPCPTKIAPYLSVTIGNKGFVGVGWYNRVLADDEVYGRYFWEFDPTKN